MKWLNRAHNTSIGKWQRAPSCEWRALWSQCQHEPMCDNLLCGKLMDNFSHVKTFICHKIWPNFFTYTGQQIEIVTKVVWLKVTPYKRGSHSTAYLQVKTKLVKFWEGTSFLYYSLSHYLFKILFTKIEHETLD